MQFVWKYIDDMVGKGLDIGVIVELLLYASATFVPMALPIAVLFASIMTMGNFGEKYELVAMKAGGVSLARDTDRFGNVTVTTVSVNRQGKTVTEEVLHLPVQLGRGGVLQGNQADAAACGLPRPQRERRALADLDCIADVSAAALCSLVQQVEASVQQALHACSGRAVELLPAEQRHQMLRYCQGTKETGHPRQP